MKWCLTAALSLVWACREAPKPPFDWVGYAIDKLYFGSEIARQVAADDVSHACCVDRSATACGALHRALSSVQFSNVLGHLLTKVDPRCQEISTHEVVVVLRNHWPNDLQGRIEAIRILSEREVTDEVLRTYVDEAGDPYLIGALTILGDEELERLVSRADDRDPNVRKTVLRALAYSLAAPVEEPVIAALERGVADPDPTIQVIGSAALRRYKDASRTPDAAVAALLAIFPERRDHPFMNPGDQVILLGVRRAFCASAAATRALEDFAKSPDPKIAAIAVQSIAVRAKRCRR